MSPNFAFWQFSVLLVASGLFLGVAVVALRWKHSLVAGPVALGLLLCTGWCVVSAVDLAATSLAGKILLHKLRFGFLPFLPVVFLEAAYRHARSRRLFVGWKLAAGLSIPIISVFLAWTPEWQDFFRSDFYLDPDMPLPTLHYAEGPWMLVHRLYSYALGLYALALLAGMVIQCRGRDRVINTLFLVCGGIPMVVDMLFALGWSPLAGLHSTPIVFVLSGGVVVWVFFGHKFNDLVPVARATLVEHLPDYLIVLDRKGRVMDLNRAAAAALGVRVEKTVGLPAREVLWPAVHAMLEKPSAEGEEVVLNGTCYECSLVPVFVGGEEPRARIFLLRDISRRKESERELREAKEAAEAGAHAKSWFLATMSHEIRTPMNGVTGFLDLLKTTPLNAEQSEYVGLISDSSESLLAIINDILDFSRIEAGRVELEIRPFDLAEMIERLCKLQVPYAAQKNIAFSWTMDPAVPRFVRGDSLRLRQVLSNLLGNAIKFTSHGGVGLSVSLRESEAGGGCLIAFVVRDTGIGISERKLERLFKPFSQAGVATTREYGGSGLGLAISKHLCELMKGRIDVESMPDRGSTFTCVLPFGPVEGAEAAVVVQDAAGGRLEIAPASQGLYVLVVEDNFVNQRLLSRLLKKMGHLAKMVQSGMECLGTLENDRFDVILMDIEMPGLDGLETTRRIREREASAPLRGKNYIIALTANALAGERERCLAAGMDDYLTKPFNPAELQAALLRSRES